MKNKILWIGFSMLFLLFIVMFIGPKLPFVDENLEQEVFRYAEEGHLVFPPFKPSSENPLGTDREGVDNFSKLILGAQETVLLVFVIVLIRFMIAIPLGFIASKEKGISNWIITSFNQLFASVPVIFLSLLIISLPFFLINDFRLLWVIFFIAIIDVGSISQIIQKQTNRISKELYVEAGVLIGNGPLRLYRNYYFPALLPEIIINFCLDVGKVMLLIGQLGVLSVFITQNWVQIDAGDVKFINTSNNWGTLLASHRADIIRTDFSFIIYPALCITYVIFTFNILGEGLRRHFNRHLST